MNVLGTPTLNILHSAFFRVTVNIDEPYIRTCNCRFYIRSSFFFYHFLFPYNWHVESVCCSRSGIWCCYCFLLVYFKKDTNFTHKAFILGHHVSTMLLRSGVGQCTFFSRTIFWKYCFYIKWSSRIFSYVKWV